MNILITGSNGLIGSEAVRFYCKMGATVIGIDNNMRAEFFGAKGSTLSVKAELQGLFPNYTSEDISITEYDELEDIFLTAKPFDLIIHCAAQPSHDLAAQLPFLDFEVNALGTLNLLELTRQYCPEAVFIHMSTNKVYGDNPNRIPMVEQDFRFDYTNLDGIDESMSLDNCTHSLFGVSKTAGDLLAQEYGRNFGLKTGIFRGGCLTGPSHAGVELHGFLSYLVKANINRIPYTIYGHKGKQVRDNIHSLDVIRAFEAFRQNPRCGEVYNIGGCRQNAISMLEAIATVECITGQKMDYTISPQARVGDHICYISDMTKFKTHYPTWSIQIGIFNLLEELVRHELLLST